MLLKHLGFGFTAVAIICFVPSIFMPLFIFDMNMAVALAGAGFSSEIVSKELSTVAAVSELWRDNRY